MYYRGIIYQSLKKLLYCSMMLIKKCCGFINIRPGLIIWAVLEIISASAQFSCFECENCSKESLAVVAVDSVVGIVASTLLLYGVIFKQKCALSLHLLSRICYMSTSIVSGILVLIFVSELPKSDLPQHIPQLILGIYMCGKFVWGFYYWLCVYSFYRQLPYYDLP